MGVNILCHFHAGPCVGLWYLIVAFPGHTRLPFYSNAGADPGFMKRGVINIKVCVCGGGGGCFADFI